MLKKISLYTAFGSIILFAIIAILSIWEVIKESDVVWKLLLSLAVIGFTGLVGVLVSDHANKNK